MSDPSDLTKTPSGILVPSSTPEPTVVRAEFTVKVTGFSPPREVTK